MPRSSAPFQRAPIFLQVTSRIVERGVMPRGELHELLQGHVTQFGGTPQGNLIFPVKFQGD